ncbi:MAG TPA: SCP2 sterol-binding domain-containing protein [Ktedonobacterales bacterium]|nr:SCP2 sterol-binding domain-containing protein [Ktedonobacterales bacterium]
MRQPMQSAQQAPGQTGGQPATAEIAEFFDKVAALGVQPRLRAVSGTCVFNITGAGSWRATITNGLPTITHDAPEDGPADCTMECSAQDFLRVVHREGNLNVLAAFLQGLVRVTGNIGFATSLLGSVTFDPVGMPGAQPR